MSAVDVRDSSPLPTLRARAVRAAGVRASQFGGGGVAVVVTYRMRARRVSTGATVRWTVTGSADADGSQSGHAGDVADIVIEGKS
jgi:hypothetical protein